MHQNRQSHPETLLQNIDLQTLEAAETYKSLSRVPFPYWGLNRSIQHQSKLSEITGLSLINSIILVRLLHLPDYQFSHL